MSPKLHSFEQEYSSYSHYPQGRALFDSDYLHVCLVESFGKLGWLSFTHADHAMLALLSFRAVDL